MNPLSPDLQTISYAHCFMMQDVWILNVFRKRNFPNAAFMTYFVNFGWFKILMLVIHIETVKIISLLNDKWIIVWHNKKEYNDCEKENCNKLNLCSFFTSTHLVSGPPSRTLATRVKKKKMFRNNGKGSEHAGPEYI